MLQAIERHINKHKKEPWAAENAPLTSSDQGQDLGREAMEDQVIQITDYADLTLTKSHIT